MMKSSKSFSSHTQRKGKSKRWRAKMRERAEAEHARRKQAREANQGERCVVVEGHDAATRFFERRQLFESRHGRAGHLVLTLAWLVHNCLAHPLLGLLPCGLTVWAHDRSADWLNLSPGATRSELPRIPNRWAWITHNCIAHPLMGLAPLRRPFDLHEHSAARMQVDGWV